MVVIPDFAAGHRMPQTPCTDISALFYFAQAPNADLLFDVTASHAAVLPYASWIDFVTSIYGVSKYPSVSILTSVFLVCDRFHWPSWPVSLPDRVAGDVVIHGLD
jgi:hypothetical protein